MHIPIFCLSMLIAFSIGCQQKQTHVAIEDPFSKDLFDAIDAADTQKISYILIHHPEWVHSVNQDKESVLEAALKSAHPLAVTKVLLEQGAAHQISPSMIFSVLAQLKIFKHLDWAPSIIQLLLEHIDLALLLSSLTSNERVDLLNGILELRILPAWIPYEPLYQLAIKQNDTLLLEWLQSYPPTTPKVVPLDAAKPLLLQDVFQRATKADPKERIPLLIELMPQIKGGYRAQTEQEGDTLLHLAARLGDLALLHHVLKESHAPYIGAENHAGHNALWESISTRALQPNNPPCSETIPFPGSWIFQPCSHPIQAALFHYILDHRKYLEPVLSSALKSLIAHRATYWFPSWDNNMQFAQNRLSDMLSRFNMEDGTEKQILFGLLREVTLQDPALCNDLLNHLYPSVRQAMNGACQGG